MTRYKYIFLSSLGLFLITLGSCKIQKGFESLDSFNYFEAKKNFEKSIQKEKSPASYGLSVIYFRNDNPFHNLDSAYHYSLLSVESFKESKEKTQIKWKEKLDFSLEKAKLHRKEISDLAFNKTVDENTVLAYQGFIAKYPWSVFKELAEQRRDSLAFLNAKSIGSSTAYIEFLKKYQNEKWENKAQTLLFRAQFDETIIEGLTQSYVDFINKFPDNPLVRDAEFQIYSLETKAGTIAEYRTFIRSFPKNPFINDAWTSLYRLSIADYKKETIEKFSNDYSDFPFQDLIQQDLKLVGKKIFQFIKNEQYGFMDESGNVVIPAKYEFAGEFNNGLAVVAKNGIYGYINKDGVLLIDYKYEEAMDFDQGRAIVLENDKYGIIDVSGTYILNPKYKDIGVFSEGLAYVQEEKGFQYYTLDGSLAFSTMYDEAFSFDKGMALVRKNEEKGYIKKDGSFVVSVENGSLKHFKDSIFIHETRDSVNLMYANGEYLFAESFDQIGVLKNNRAIIEKNGQYGYIDGKGKIIIPMEHTPYSNYTQFAQFENGHVVIKRNGKFAMMDSLGKSVLPAIFTGIGTFGELIPITKGDGWGYSNKDVYLKIKYQYSYAYGFVNGGAIVERDDLMGVIGLENEEIIPIAFESIKRMSNDILLVKQAGFYGLLTISNETVVASNYDRIQELSPNLFQLIKGQNVTYYEVNNNRIISLQD
ncbi:WG repeat-containing protein [Brumimicrobium mesophilum]|uniref:WG repeat-containing protein n=1 Tax=Brumimicrobium mesophilum TaxID=392717 RepID=UPI000D13F9EB|nr:WG repeat-containing protein [Brumimicrobium mesophilum]